MLISPSPAFLSLIKRIFNQQEAEVILKTYDKAGQFGSLNEDSINREIGASFNPRPCRIGHILIVDIKTSDLTTLCASFFSCCEEPPDANMPLDLKNFLELGFLAKDFYLKGQPQKQLYLTTLIIDIVAALFLDEIRHLHLSSIQFENKKERVIICAKFIKDFLPATHPLLHLLEFALKKYV